MLDVHVGAVWDCVHTYVTNDGFYSYVRDKLDVINTAPHFVAYVERFRADPRLNRYRFRRAAVEKHGVRSFGWPKD